MTNDSRALGDSRFAKQRPECAVRDLMMYVRLTSFNGFTTAGSGVG